MSDTGIAERFSTRLPGFVRRDPAVVIAFGCIVVLLQIGRAHV